MDFHWFPLWFQYIFQFWELHQTYQSTVSSRVTAPGQSVVNSLGRRGHIPSSSLDPARPCDWQIRSSLSWRHGHANPDRRAICPVWTTRTNISSRPKRPHDLAHSACHSVGSGWDRWCWCGSGHMPRRLGSASVPAWTGTAVSNWRPWGPLTTGIAGDPKTQILQAFHPDGPELRWKWWAGSQTSEHWMQAWRMANLAEVYPWWFGQIPN